MKQRKKTGVALAAACVLLCLVLISSHLTSGIYAKYVGKTQGSELDRGSAFHVSAAISGEAGVYGLSFTNDSETAVVYSVTVRPKQPDMFSAITLGGVTDPTPDENGAVTFPALGTLAPGSSGSAALTLIFNPNYSNPELVSELLDFSNDSVSTADMELPFTVTVTFEQID